MKVKKYTQCVKILCESKHVTVLSKISPTKDGNLNTGKTSGSSSTGIYKKLARRHKSIDLPTKEFLQNYNIKIGHLFLEVGAAAFNDLSVSDQISVHFQFLCGCQLEADKQSIH